MTGEAIGGYATAFTIVVTLGIFIYQTYKARFRTSVEVVLECEKRFNSSSFEKKRIQAAQSALEGDIEPAQPIFDFFDTVGYLVRKGIIQKEIAWAIFYDWVIGYWSVGGAYMDQARGTDKTIWNEFEYLHETMVRVQRAALKKPVTGLLDEADKVRFLNDELKLLATRKVEGEDRG